MTGVLCAVYLIFWFVGGQHLLEQIVAKPTGS